MDPRDIAELQALLAILDEGNFARAASRIGVTPSAMSQTIRRLEDRLGQRLLNRTTRSTQATEAGLQLAEQVRPALAAIAAAQAEIASRSGRVTGRLRINVSRAVAVHVLAPLLPAFAAQHPGIETVTMISEHLDDIVATGCDAGIRPGGAIERDMVTVPMNPSLRWIAIASPGYLSTAGVPQHPRDLVHHQCLNMSWPNGGPVYRWEFRRGKEQFTIAVRGPLCTDDATMRLSSVEAGLGIGYFLDIEARDLLQQGKAVEVLSEWCPREPGFRLYFPGNRLVTPPLRAFLDFIRTK
ncbi:LysR family transcriptional regulator [Roseovarius sp.]|uniref:LysR family transcriptional regulator n=1 Tax=Roseovarius sp. TaxID=1486281 RepID=UPI003BA95B6D